MLVSKCRPGMTEQRGETICDHLFDDLALDRPVRGRRIAPPPPILLHCPGGGDEPVCHCLEVAIGIIEAEDQAAGADPAQRQAFGTQVVLQHPIVTRWPRVANGPN